jgi:predicted amidohydrolase YtcJ
MTKHTIGILLAAAVAAGCARDGKDPGDAQKSAVADLALRNGAIYTVDGARSWAETVAIDDGRIVYVGTDAGAKDWIGPQTQVVDLKGRMVVPGFQDVHIHPISGGIEANGCDLNAATTVEEYLAVIKKYADEHPEELWIKGGGWSMASFGPGALARKELIDAVVPDRPVILWSRDGHTTWVNSKALEVAGITKDTPDPADGRIDRDPKTGEPSGSLQEGASSLVADKAPPNSDQVRDDGLRYASRPTTGWTRPANSRCTSSAPSGGSASRASSRSRTSSACAASTRKAAWTRAPSRSCRTACSRTTPASSSSHTGSRARPTCEASRWSSRSC